jgi:hypothetical protein
MIIFILILLILGCESDHEKHSSGSDTIPGRVGTSSTSSYTEIIQSIQEKRNKFAAEYRNTSSSVKKGEILSEARIALITAIRDDIFPRWMGTSWDFNGTTEVPGEGEIACGYFVTTVLRDAGFKLERYRLAQQSSERIIKSLVKEKYIRRYSYVSINEFFQSIKEWGEGLYVIGLDIHVGFILSDSSGVYFVHSSYMEPYEVVREPVMESKILRRSRYRVLGKILEDDLLIEKWMQEIFIPTLTLKLELLEEAAA